jgi:hypothetical protein
MQSRNLLLFELELKPSHVNNLKKILANTMMVPAITDFTQDLVACDCNTQRLFKSKWAKMWLNVNV